MLFSRLSHLTRFYLISIRTRIKTCDCLTLPFASSRSIHIPLEQGLRRVILCPEAPLHRCSIHIPLEQGLRPRRIFEDVGILCSSIHIPLEQGLRRNNRPVLFLVLVVLSNFH